MEHIYVTEHGDAAMFTYRKGNEGVWNVFQGDTYLGIVTKRDAWTVRGSHAYWTARKNGKTIGRECTTRKEAAEYLK